MINSALIALLVVCVAIAAICVELIQQGHPYIGAILAFVLLASIRVKSS